MKRAFDLTAGMLGLVLTSPIVAVAAIAVKFDSSGPAFFSGRRTGKDGREFRIHKLRSMEVATGAAITAGDDPRITRVGRFLRRTKIDELPQLLNVVKGEMSLVGPRPEDPAFVLRYTPEQRRLLTVRPGITSSASLAFIHEETQLRGGSPENLYLTEVMPKKLALELEYLDRATFFSDLGVLFRTVGAVFQRR